MQPGGPAATSMYVYVDSEDTLPSNLICAVCHDVAGTHSACPGCQQTFCEVGHADTANGPPFGGMPRLLTHLPPVPHLFAGLRAQVV